MSASPLKADMRELPRICPLRAKSGLMHYGMGCLFDHLVGEREHAGRNSEGERFGGLEINNQLEFGRLHHRQISRPLALEDAVNIRRRSTPLVNHVSPIGC